MPVLDEGRIQENARKSAWHQSIVQTSAVEMTPMVFLVVFMGPFW
jgi:hypothetical protein